VSKGTVHPKIHKIADYFLIFLRITLMSRHVSIQGNPSLKSIICIPILSANLFQVGHDGIAEDVFGMRTFRSCNLIRIEEVPEFHFETGIFTKVKKELDLNLKVAALSGDFMIARKLAIYDEPEFLELFAHSQFRFQFYKFGRLPRNYRGYATQTSMDANVTRSLHRG
jgi:hypothetical protein